MRRQEGQGRPAARRLVRLIAARRGHLRRPEASTTAPTGVATGTCFRQVEYAGLLSNAGNTEGGKALLDFMLTKTFQDDMPLNMFVYPVREGAQVPEEFTKYGPQAEDPETMDPAKIADNRDDWVKSWTSLVLK